MSDYDIASRFSIVDHMTPALKSIASGLSSVMDSMEMINASSKGMIDVGAIRNGRVAVEGLNDVISDIEKITGENAKEQEKHNQKIKDGANRGSELLGQIKAVAATYISMQGVKMVIGLSDEMTLTTARLNQVNDGLQSTEELNQMIYNSAMRSRGAYMQTADIVSKMALQAGHSFTGNQETIVFAEQLQKRFKIAGTDAQGIESVMYNLTQALSTGVLRGQDLNSVLANAPSIAQDTAKYMGYTVDEVKALAEEGELTARKVIEAMLATAEETDEAFKSIPMTFGDMWTMAINHIQMAIQPVLNRMNELINTESFQQGVTAIVNGITWIIEMLVEVLAVGMEVFAFLSEHLKVIEPIIMGVVGTFGAWLAMTVLLSGALKVLNLVMNANPIILLITAIITVIAWIYKWIQSVGGIQIAWLMAKNTFWNTINAIQIWFATMVMNVTKDMNNMQVGIATVVMGVKNWFTDMKVNVINLAQDMVNGVIDAINWLIDKVNKLPFVAIDAIQGVNWAVEAKVDAEATKQARKGVLNDLKAENDAQIAEMEKNITSMQIEASANRLDRENEIAKIKNQLDSKAKESEINNFLNPENYQDSLGSAGGGAGSPASTIGDIAKNSGDTAKNTEAMAKDLNRTADDLASIREILTIRQITNLTVGEVKVEQNNSFGDIHGVEEVGGITSGLVDMISEEFQVGIGGI